MIKLYHEIKNAFNWFTNYLNEIAGVPNYGRYIKHFQKSHPGVTPLSKKEFFCKANDEKYGGGKIRRCC